MDDVTAQRFKKQWRVLDQRGREIEAQLAAAPKVKITERALVQRLKRRFARDGETFHVTRGTTWNRDLGYWYSTEGNVVRWACHALEDLIAVAREMGVLKPYETVATEEVAS